MNNIRFIMQPRTEKIGELIKQCARKELGFDELCIRVRAMGYNTTSLYEMVIAEENSNA